ncbi:UDP-N-acetylmuramate--L-alanine ligase [Candidatus Roizmanbacteria bacterium]|nr:UDP-N-acetylmuramate--L-alanine ligase [Candidatus Roizmanbacteria bacterium]
MKKKHIHFVGIKGVGVAPLALIAKEAGFEVTGSDIEKEFITDLALSKAGIKPSSGFSPDHISIPDLVITTGAHNGFDNVEAIAAKEKNIPVMSQGEAVGAFMNGEILGKKFKGISVAGTHGKTTTTAMLATILEENQLDPSYVIGTGDVGSLSAPGHLGKGNYFIAEADEYISEPKHDRTIKFLWQHPEFAVITNIEYDHPDVYASIDEIRVAFAKLANQVSPSGALVACGDDRQIRKMLRDYEKKVITYGLNSDNDYILKKVNVSGNQTFFWVETRGMSLGEFGLQVPGEHNALNALAAIIVCLELGLPIEKIKKGLHVFLGSKRRLEFIGELTTGAKVYDDYAHHPTEIKKTLKTLRQQYPNKKILCIFQPHTYSRTKMLFEEFTKAFDNIDELFVIVTEIYASLREAPDNSISGEKLVESISLSHKDIHYLPALNDVVQYINEKKFRADTILVTMGAGDIYTIHSKLNFV